MHTARSTRRTASTYLVHFFGGGLQEGGRYVVERYETAASGEIRPLGADDPTRAHPNLTACPRRSPSTPWSGSTPAR